MGRKDVNMTELFIATGRSFAHLTQDETGWHIATGLPDKGVRAIAVDPADPNNLFAGSSSTGLWKSVDRGASWEQPDFPESNIYSVAVSPADGSVYVGTEPSMLFKSADRGRTWVELAALREIPSAPTWSFPPRPWTSHVRWIAPNPQDPNLLLAGIELGGIMTTADGGRTWRDHPAGAVKDVHELAWHPTDASRAYEAGGGGAAWSSDGAETWTPADEGRGHHYVWALAVDPEDPDQWFGSAARGPSDAHSGTYGGSHHANAQIYRWREAGPWEALPGPAEATVAMPYALSIAEGRFFAGLADGQIFVSDNYGDTWSKISPAGEQIKSISGLVTV